MNTKQIKEQPSYYAVLTAEVRYSKVLKPMEKLMYAEITVLANTTGECYATNKYFAELYDVSVETVSRWIANLAKHGFINRRIKYKEGSKQIEKRFISLAHPIDEKVNTPLDENVMTPIDKKVKDNTTSFNISSLIENFYPNEISLLAVKDSYGDVSNQVLRIAIQEFKDAATNRDKPFKDVQSGFRNYVRKGYLSASFTTKPQTHAQMRGKVIQAQVKPNLDDLALQKSMKKLERANG